MEILKLTNTTLMYVADGFWCDEIYEGDYEKGLDIIFKKLPDDKYEPLFRIASDKKHSDFEIWGHHVEVIIERLADKKRFKIEYEQPTFNTMWDELNTGESYSFKEVFFKRTEIVEIWDYSSEPTEEPEYSCQFIDELDKLSGNQEEHLEERNEHNAYEVLLKNGIVADYKEFLEKYYAFTSWKIHVNVNVYKK